METADMQTAPSAKTRPGVILWFKVYCGLLCLMYFLVMAASLIFFLVDPEELETEAGVALIMGVVMALTGGALFAVVLVPLILSPRPWLWIYDLIVICLGMTSACFWPICIPLLIFWLKPETKQYFRKCVV
ncbi:MAG: hypothetical protein ABFD91_02255 [Anaerohalosphaeraceae bacterium]